MVHQLTPWQRKSPGREWGLKGRERTRLGKGWMEEKEMVRARTGNKASNLTGRRKLPLYAGYENNLNDHYYCSWSRWTLPHLRKKEGLNHMVWGDSGTVYTAVTFREIRMLAYLSFCQHFWAVKNVKKKLWVVKMSSCVVFIRMNGQNAHGRLPFDLCC